MVVHLSVRKERGKTEFSLVLPLLSSAQLVSQDLCAQEKAKEESQKIISCQYPLTGTPGYKFTELMEQHPKHLPLSSGAHQPR